MVSFSSYILFFLVMLYIPKYTYINPRELIIMNISQFFSHLNFLLSILPNFFSYFFFKKKKLNFAGDKKLRG